ncbi:OB-fold domain-containing protein [Caballeronia sp. LZ034LL]|uniref:OB-fold domain-containing protein n=1 Tax=Caballeronia sp. LZ034LL TaxID=3038567 RepID=UPI0028676B58|nr:OB-fold domain-containing protein [Caballeronia sp. LZ034LL]MDR5836187.1 OB-fold domain-containing protein [Caballeronia sp. LZ034LL]
MIGILACGAYVPRLRLQRASVSAAHAWFAPALKAHGKGERAMANWDEDALTLAVEAARDAAPEAARGEIGTLMLASTSLPFADRQNAGIVKEALNLADDVFTQDITGSQKAGTGALIQALRGAASADAAHTLCIASERAAAKPASEAELINGDAAAAFVLGRGEPIARFIGSHSVSIDFVDHFRGSDASFDYGWEARWVRDEGYGRIAGDALTQALAKFGLAGEDVHRLIVPIPVRGVAEALARTCGVPASAIVDTLGATLGHAGCAQPLVLLAHALERAQPGERIVLLGFGQGADVLIFETTPAIATQAHATKRGVSGWLARGKPEANYLKYLFFTGGIGLDTGMRAEFEQKQPLTALYRNRSAVLGLVGGRDPESGAVQYPPTGIAVGSHDARSATLEPYPLAERTARVLTFTADRLAFTPDPPGCYGMVEFDGGGRMLAEFTDADADQIEVGRAMRMSFRIKSVDERRGFVKYFWKAMPA